MVLSSYSQLSDLGLLQEVLKNHKMLQIKPRVSACKACASAL